LFLNTKRLFAAKGWEILESKLLLFEAINKIGFFSLDEIFDNLN
jgi:hypothetical protein